MALLQQRLEQVKLIEQQASEMRRVDIARLNEQLDQLDDQAEHQRAAKQFDLQAQSEYEANQAALQRRLLQLNDRLNSLQAESQRDALILRDVNGTDHRIPLSQIVEAWQPNAMSLTQKWGISASRCGALLAIRLPKEKASLACFRRYLARCSWCC